MAGKRRNIWFPETLWDELSKISRDSVVFDGRVARVVKIACERFLKEYWEEKRKNEKPKKR